MNEKDSTQEQCCTEEEIDMAKVDAILADYEGRKGALIPVLQKTQKAYGYLPEAVLNHISEKLSIYLSEIYGVVTFYAQFYLEPRGKHAIMVCRGTACHVKGAVKILEAIQNKLGVGTGESTADMKFVVEGVACVGACGIAPVMMIDEQTFGSLSVSMAVDAVLNFEPSEEEEE